jgi:alkylation response protein AidB-like acyl-CoA dehydrogenase
MAGMTISLTAVLQFANNEAWKNKIAQEVFSGKKKICLAITEAFAGSDVAGLRTTAAKTKDGKHYIVNGTKKWITNGAWCDYFITGVKTGRFCLDLDFLRCGELSTAPLLENLILGDVFGFRS